MQEGLTPPSQSSASDSADILTVQGEAQASVTILGLTISPHTATVAPGATVQFTPQGWVDGGGPPVVAPVIWTVTGGTITSGGLYQAGTIPGSYYVKARLTTRWTEDSVGVTISGSAPVTVINGITLSPPSVSLPQAGSQQFTASASLSNGTTQTNPTVSWTATGGTISSSGQYTAGNTAGNYQVIARSSNGKADTSAVSITALTINGITLSPASASLSTGGTRQFTASATMSNGSTQANPAVTWTATGGTVSNSGMYTAGTTAGAFKVIARSGNGKADTSAVTIAGLTITGITLSPASASLNAGDTKQFGVSATMSNGTTQSNPAVTWSTNGGTISQGGLYTAGGSGGSYQVIARSTNGMADTAAVTVASQSQPPSGGGSYPHRPSNFNRVVAALDQSQAIPSGDGERYLAGFPNTWSIVGGSGTVTRESDASAPGSPSSVWRVYEKAGSYGGGTPGAGSSTGFGRWGLPINASAIYGSIWVKWSPGYRFHPISQKFVRMDVSGQTQAFLIQASHNGQFARASDEGLGQAFEPQNGATPSLGVWHQVEFVVVRGNPGSIKVWLDGQLRLDRTGPLATAGNFATFEVHSEMGGGGVTLPADQWFMIDDVFVAAQ